MSDFDDDEEEENTMFVCFKRTTTSSTVSLNYSVVLVDDPYIYIYYMNTNILEYIVIKICGGQAPRSRFQDTGVIFITDTTTILENYRYDYVQPGIG